MRTKTITSRTEALSSRRVVLRVLGGAVVGALLLAGGARPGRADQTTDVSAFLMSLTDRAIAELTDSSVPVDERKNRFRTLFKDNFDIPAIGRFVLGRYWNAADEPARQEFLTVFEDVMVERFAPQFTGYAGASFQIGSIREVNEDNQIMVSSTVAPPNAEVVQVDWRVRNDGGRFRVLDVTGQGVSMALTLRSEYASVIKNSGGRIDSLIALLRDRIAKSG